MIKEQKIIDILNEKYSDIKEELKLQEKPVLIHLTKDNSVRANNPAILFYGEEGIFICILDYPNADEVIALRKITFKNVKGLKIEKAKFNETNILTANGGHFVFSIPNTGKVEEYEAFKKNKAEFLNFLIKFETESKESAIKEISNRKRGRFIIFITPLIAILILFIKFSHNMGRLEFFLKLLALIIVYNIIFAVIRVGIMALKDRGFTKEFNNIMKEFSQDKDSKKLYNSLKNIASKPLNIQNKNTYYLSLAIASYSLGEVDEAKEMIARIVFDQREMIGLSGSERMQYLQLKEELYGQ